MSTENRNEERVDDSTDLPIMKARTDSAIGLASRYESWRTTFAKLSGEVERLERELAQAQKQREHAREQRDKAHDAVRLYIHGGMYEPEVYVSARRPGGDA